MLTTRECPPKIKALFQKALAADAHLPRILSSPVDSLISKRPSGFGGTGSGEALCNGISQILHAPLFAMRISRLTIGSFPP